MWGQVEHDDLGTPCWRAADGPRWKATALRHLLTFLTPDMTTAEILVKLQSQAEPKYRDFAASLIPGEADLLGVRLPLLRKLARRVARQENWAAIFQELGTNSLMEVVMLRGMLPGYAPNATLSERLRALAAFIPTIRNWSICDSCCATYTFAREFRAEVLDFLQPYLGSTEEYEARFAVVMLLNHYLNDSAYVAHVAKLLSLVNCRAYYADMAVAWCACELILRYPEYEAELITRLSPDIQKLTQRKIRESHRCRGN